MKLNQDKFYVDEKQSNPMRVAICYPGCPINAVCVHMVVGFGTILKQCKYLRSEKSMNQAECLKGEDV